MTVRCVTCSEFSLRPRPSNGSNEPMREIDRKFLALGAGRCAFNTKTNQWYPAEYERECGRHKAIPADQVDKRRALLKDRQDAVRDTLGT